MSEQVQEVSLPEPSRTPAAEAVCVLESLLKRMRLRGKITASEDAECIALQVTGPDAGLVVGKKGATLEALEYMTNRILSRQGRQKLVLVDSDGFRQRHEAALVEMAQRMAEKAQQECKAMMLEPMSPRDRRIVHLALRDTAGITTRSEGQGEQRRLLVVPEPRVS